MRIIILILFLILSNTIYSISVEIEDDNLDTNTISNTNIIEEINANTNLINVNSNITILKLTNSLGASIYGLSYRYWPGDYGFQISIFPVMIESYTLLKLELLLFKNIYHREYSRFSLFTGIILTYTKTSNYNIPILFDEGGTITFNFGLCYDIYLTKVIYVPIFIGYDLNLRFDNNFTNFNINTAVIPNIGIYFEF